MAPIENQPSRREADYPSKTEFGDQTTPVPATPSSVKKPATADTHKATMPTDDRDTMPKELPLDVPMRHTEQ